METIQDFEDLLELFERFEVRYLIVGGLAFIYHARPKYTKDMDLWLDSDRGKFCSWASLPTASICCAS